LITTAYLDIARSTVVVGDFNVNIVAPAHQASIHDDKGKDMVSHPPSRNREMGLERGEQGKGSELFGFMNYLA
jgi:hypothetical protein